MTEREQPKPDYIGSRSDKRKEREGQSEPKPPVEPNHPEPPKRPSSLWTRLPMPDGTFSRHYFRIFREGKR